jgi:hypothetical protein
MQYAFVVKFLVAIGVEKGKDHIFNLGDKSVVIFFAACRLVLFINILVDFESFHLYFNINILLLLEYYTQTTLRGII